MLEIFWVIKMKIVALSVTLLSLFTFNGYCSDPFAFNLSSENDLLMDSCELILAPEEPYLPKTPTKKFKENEGDNSNQSPSPIKKPKASKRKFAHAKKSLPEPVSQRGIMTSAQASLLNDDDWDDDSQADNHRSTRARKQAQLLDGLHIMHTKTNRRAQVLFEPSEDKMAGIICPHRNSATPEEPNLVTWSLTRDITILIFSLLDNNSIKQAALTCGYFANVANRRPTLKFAPHVAEQDVVNVLATKCHFLRHLDLYHCRDLRSETFQAIAPKLNLKSFVTYSNISGKSMEILGETNKNIQKIIFRSRTSSYDEIKRCISALFQKYPSLEHIFLENIYVKPRFEKQARKHLLKLTEAHERLLTITIHEHLSAFIDQITNPLVQIVFKKNR